MNNDDWLKEKCNRYINGICTTHGCLRRGGWDGKTVPVPVELATCQAYEILKELEQLRMNATNNLPPGVLARDLDQPETCACCGDQIEGQVWRDDQQEPFCADCVEIQTAKHWAKYESAPEPFQADE